MPSGPLEPLAPHRAGVLLQEGSPKFGAWDLFNLDVLKTSYKDVRRVGIFGLVKVWIIGFLMCVCGSCWNFVCVDSWVFGVVDVWNVDCWEMS